MDSKIFKYFLLHQRKTAVDISPELYEQLKQVTEKNPRLSLDLLVDIALDYIAHLKEEDLLKLITEYYGRKHHTSNTSK